MRNNATHPPVSCARLVLLGDYFWESLFGISAYYLVLRMMHGAGATLFPFPFVSIFPAGHSVSEGYSVVHRFYYLTNL